jgi:hypothetical protein
MDFVAVVNGSHYPPVGRALVIERVPEHGVKVVKAPGPDGDAVRFSAEPDLWYHLAPAGGATRWQYRRSRPESGDARPFLPLDAKGV